MTDIAAFIGLDVHKDTISVAVAAAGRDGEVRHYGEIANIPEAIGKLARRLVKLHGTVEFAYEAGTCGYTLHRQLSALGLDCRVVAPSRIPKRPGERIKNDTRDALMLARLLRAGELSFVWIPDEAHEAMRDLVRARQTAANDVRQVRSHIQMFLPKRGIRFVGKPWTRRHRVWLADRNFEHPAQRIALQSYINRLEQAESRKLELEKQIEAFLPEWTMAPVVRALQALKGVGLVIAATMVAEIGDFSRFANPRQLMAHLGLVPGEHSSGGSIRPRGITKAGNTMARSLLFEAAWSYRLPAKVGQTCWGKQHGMDQWLKDVAWRAQLRLTTRYRRLLLRGKRSQVAVTAVARELVGFIWSIATQRRSAGAGLNPPTPSDVSRACRVRQRPGHQARNKGILEQVFCHPLVPRQQVE